MYTIAHMHVTSGSRNPKFGGKFSQARRPAVPRTHVPQPSGACKDSLERAAVSTTAAPPSDKEHQIGMPGGYPERASIFRVFTEHAS